MNVRSLILTLLMAAPPCLMALDRTEADSLVVRARSAYDAGDHRLALTLYDSVRISGSTSASLLYNIGNCHFKLGDIPHAILFFERALILEPGAPDVLANLELAEQQVVDRIAAPPRYSLGTGWERFRGGGDPDAWARRSVWLMLVLFGLLGLALFLQRGSLRLVVLGLSAAAALATISALALAALRHAEVNDHGSAIVMSAKVDVRSEPGSNGTVLFVLHKGTKVQVNAEANGWMEIRLPNGSVGWMPPATVERI